jgi:hypothetical protein
MLYSKATGIALTDVDTASSLTLMSADIERIVTGMETGHEVRWLSSLSASNRSKGYWSSQGPRNCLQRAYLVLTDQIRAAGLSSFLLLVQMMLTSLITIGMVKHN